MPRQPTVTEEFVFFPDCSTMPAIMMATDPGGGRPFTGEPQFHPHEAMMPPQPDLAKLRKIQDHENLRNMLIAWNANRLDLFELSMPNEVRFYYFF